MRFWRSSFVKAFGPHVASDSDLRLRVGGVALNSRMSLSGSDRNGSAIVTIPSPYDLPANPKAKFHPTHAYSAPLFLNRKVEPS